MDEQRKCGIYVHKYIHKMEYDSTIKRDLAICDNMDRSRWYYAKWNKSDKDKLYDFTCMWNLKNNNNKKNKQNKNRLIDTENKWVVARTEGNVGEEGKEA